MNLSDLFEIVLTGDTLNSPVDYVAIGNIVNIDNEADHSAILIKYDGNIYQFEFTGSAIKFDSYSKNFYQKTTFTISPLEIPAFIAYCRIVKEKANPKFDFFFSGTFYDEEGNFIGNNTVAGERMTCVGFCLNVLNGFLEEQYLNFSDWDHTTYDDGKYLSMWCERHGVDESVIQKEHRRISPRELFATAFFKDLPIFRKQVNEALPHIEEYFNRVTR